MKLDSEEKTKWVSIVKRGKIEGEYKAGREGSIPGKDQEITSLQQNDDKYANIRNKTSCCVMILSLNYEEMRTM